MAKRTKGKRINYKKLFFNLFTLALSCYFAFTLIGQQKEIKSLEKKKEAQVQEIEGIDREKKSLEGELSQVNSDSFIEKTAREKLGMVKSNEIIYIDKDKEDNKKER